MVLDRLYQARNLKEIESAFEYRERIKTRWNSIKPRTVIEEIKEIDIKTDNWYVGIVNKIYRDTFNNYFNDNIKKYEHKVFTKEWHQKLKRLSNYSKSNGLLDL